MNRRSQGGARPSLRRSIGARPIRVCVQETAIEAVRRFLGDDREGIEHAFARGNVVWANDDVVAPSDPVEPGEILWTYVEAPDEPAAPIKLPVIARNERWIAVDKPHGMATMPRGSHVAQTVIVAARRQFGSDEIVAAHRLDAATAGVVLLTAGVAWRAPYQLLFEKRKVSKRYLAVAPVWDYGDSRQVALRLVKDRGNPRAQVVSGEANAWTRIRLVENHGGLGLYEIVPETGKTHQIRVSMAHLGVPIVGDTLYGGDLRSGLPLQLSAYELGFDDPISGEPVALRSRQAESIRAAVRQGPSAGILNM